MNKEIFNQVVNMDLKHEGFTAAAKAAMSVVSSLKEKLDFRDAAKTLQSSMDKVQSSFDKFSSSPMSNAVETVIGKFSSLEAVAFGALERIGQKAADAGIRIAKSLTVDQISSGFGEYELKMGSVQTIMASTGESLDTVNKYLGELNDYSDQTIYSFSDMTASIGKFTNAGVSLSDAVAAIKGISNEAALSGANANEASRAMYNFSQALSSGAVKLIDWKSIENANMATKEFKNELIKTAVELGTLQEVEGQYISTTTDMNGKVSDAFTATSKFNDSLSTQWMTSDVLTKTLAKYADETTDLGKRAKHAAQDFKTWTQLIDAWKEAVGSGWAQTFEIIVGDLEEAKEFFGRIDDIVSPFLNKIADDRNALLEGWDKLGGRDLLIDTLTGALTNLFNVIQAARDGIQWLVDWTLAGASAAEKMAEWTSKIAGFFKGLELNGAQLAIFSDIFETISIGVTDTIDTFRNVKSIIKNITDVLGSFKWMTEPIKGFFDGLGDLGEKTIRKMQPALDKGNALLQHWKHIGDELHNIKYGLPKKEEEKEDADAEETEKNAEKAEEKGLEADSIWQKVSNTISGALTLVNGVFRKIWEFVQSDILGPIVDHATDFAMLVHGIGAILHSVWASVSPFISGLGKLGVSIIPKVVSGIANIAGGIGQILANHAGDIGKLIRGALSLFLSLAGRIVPFMKNLGGLGGSIIPKLISGFLTLTGKVGEFMSKVAEFIRTSSLLSAIGQSFSEIAEKVKGLFDRIGRNGAEGHVSLLERFTNVLDNLKRKLGPVVDKIKELFSRLKEGVKGAFSGGVTSPIVGGGLLAGILLIAKKIADVIGNIKNATDVLDVKNLFSNITDKIGEVFEPLTSYLDKLTALKNVEILKQIAKALAILAGAILLISLIDPERLSESLMAVTVLLTELMGSLAVFTKFFSGKDFAHLSAASSSMIKLSVSIFILSLALNSIAGIESEKLGPAILGLGAMLTLLGGFIFALEKIDVSGSIKSASSAIAKISRAMVVLSLAMKIVGTMDWAELAVAGAGLTVGLAAIAGALVIVSRFSKNNPATAASAIMIVSAALVILSAALKIVGTMDWAELAVAGAGLAGGLLAISVALGVLSTMGGSVLAAAGALLAASVGMIALAAAIAILSSIKPESLAAGILAFVAALAILTAASIALTYTGAFVGLLAIAGSLCAVVLSIAGAFAIMASSSLKLAGAMAIIANIDLKGKIGPVIGAIASLVGISLIALPLIPVIALLSEALKSLAIAMMILGASNIATSIGLESISSAVSSLLASVLSAIANAIPTIIAMVLTLIQGILSAIDQHIGQIIALLASILIKIMTALGNWAPALGQAAAYLVGMLINGLASGLNEAQGVVLDSLGNLLAACINLVISAIQKVVELIPGVGTKWSKALEQAKQDVSNTLGDGTLDNSGANAANETADGYVQKMGERKADMSTAAANAGKEANSSFLSAFTGEKESENGGLFSNLLSSLSGHDDEISGLGSGYGTSFSTGFSNLLGGGSENGGIFSGFLSSLSGHESEVEGTGQSYGSALLTGFDSSFASEDGTTSVGGVDSLLSAITGSEEQFKGGGETLADATSSGFESKSLEVAPKAGESAVDLFVGPITNSEAKAKPAGEALAGNAASGADSKKDAFESAANNAVDGFVNASDARSQDAYDAGARIAESYNLGLQNKMEIESPSKVMYHNGEYTVDGYINAIYDKTKEVEKAGAITAKAAEDGITTPLSSLSDILSGEFDDAMTITPVLDLSQIQNDASRLRDMLDGARVSVGRMDISGIMPDYSRSDKADDRTLNELKGLRKDMADFNEKLANMQVRMDTGELVGTLASPMDRELGRRAALKARR